MSGDKTEDTGVKFMPPDWQDVSLLPQNCEYLRTLIEAIKETNRHIEALLQEGNASTAEKTQQRAEKLIDALVRVPCREQ